MKLLVAAVLIFVGLTPLVAEPGWNTKVYDVAGDFLKTTEVPVPEGPEKRAISKQPVSAKMLLESVGVEFPEGSFADFNESSLKLIVHNTDEQLKKIEIYLEAEGKGVQKQIYLNVREIRCPGEIDEFVGIATAISKEKFPEVPPLFQNMLPVPERPKLPKAERGFSTFHVSGSLTDLEFQKVIRVLSQIRGIDLTSFPSVMARSEQFVITQNGIQRFGMNPTSGPGESSIKLDFFIPRGNDLLSDDGQGMRSTVSLKFNDGETVGVVERNSEGHDRIIFVQAQLMDVAGHPIAPVKKGIRDSNHSQHEFDEFLVTTYQPLSKWFDDNFEVDYKEMTPQLIFDQVPLSDIYCETSNLPEDAPAFQLWSSKISRRELLFKIAEFWDLQMTLVLDDGGKPTAVKVEGPGSSAGTDIE
jgi:hypothetical protein